MTAQEKAKQLIERFYLETAFGPNGRDVARKCAMICVNEICDTNGIVTDNNYHYGSATGYFWEDVKEEIQNLD